jgi:FMN phosphatase YigB (HAD superfamily)
MPEVRVVIFDLGRVLVDLDFSEGLLAHAPGGGADSFESVRSRFAQDPLLRDFGTGRIGPEAFHREACRRLGLDLSFPRFRELWCNIFRESAGMEALVAEVAARRPVGLLSDTDPLHWAYLRERFPFLERFARPTLSFETGVLKPDPHAYRAAAEHAGVPPEACFFTDDIPGNVEGARRAGMDAVVFRGADALRAELGRRGVL